MSPESQSEITNSTDEIQDLLKKLDEDSLKRSYNSVQISFEQMLAYTRNISRSEGMPAEIRLLLDTYHAMAEKFYAQYKLTLLEEMWKQRTSGEEADRVLALLAKTRTRFSEQEVSDILDTTKTLLDSRVESAQLDYDKLLKDFPTLLQQALDKLKDEWQRIHGIAIASEAITRGENSRRDGELIRSLEVAVQTAAYTTGIETERIVIVPGNAFALYFFSYLDNLAILTVPIYSVQAPWEWSIFWHELAGYKVRQLESESIINRLRNGLVNLHTIYKTIPEADQVSFLEAVTNVNPKTPGQTAVPFSVRNLQNMLIDNEPDLSEAGGFGHQFERMLANLGRKKDRFQIYEQIKRDGWCVDWFKELFEDAWSVLTFRWDFMIFFKDILSRHTVLDGRHPPMAIRLQVASKILDLEYPFDDPRRMEVLNGMGLSSEEETFTTLAAQQILIFKSLIVLSRHPILQTVDAANQILIQQNSMLTDLQQVQEPVHVSVNQLITKSILSWTNRLAGANIAGEPTNFADLLNQPARDHSKKDPMPSYEQLLLGKNFRQLLELSFFDRDFLSSSQIKNVRLGPGIRAATPFSVVAATVNFILDRNLLVPGSGGDICFDIGIETFHTTKTNWNDAFRQHQGYQLQ